jgi:hypothetical protein
MLGRTQALAYLAEVDLPPGAYPHTLRLLHAEFGRIPRHPLVKIRAAAPIDQHSHHTVLQLESPVAGPLWVPTAPIARWHGYTFDLLGVLPAEQRAGVQTWRLGLPDLPRPLLVEPWRIRATYGDDPLIAQWRTVPGDPPIPTIWGDLAAATDAARARVAKGLQLCQFVPQRQPHAGGHPPGDRYWPTPQDYLQELIDKVIEPWQAKAQPLRKLTTRTIAKALNTSERTIYAENDRAGINMAAIKGGRVLRSSLQD